MPGASHFAGSVMVMGVSGAGKSTVGLALAQWLELPFLDADTLHSESNRQKMMARQPLTDEDRWPWLDAVADKIQETSLVVACSALRRAYRDRIRIRGGDVWCLELRGSRDILVERVTSRPGHFMPASLLDSQLETLESLEPDELGLTVDAANTVGEIVTEAAAAFAAFEQRS